MGGEIHKQTQFSDHDDGCGLAVIHAHPDEHEPFDSPHYSGGNGAQWMPAQGDGHDLPTTHRSSTMPRPIHACRGNAPNEETSTITLSNMNTFMTPDAV